MFLGVSLRPLRLCVNLFLMTDKELTHAIIGAAIAVHRELGPGLLETVYEECLCDELRQRRMEFEKQKAIPSSIARASWIVDTGLTS